MEKCQEITSTLCSWLKQNKPTFCLWFGILWFAISVILEVVWFWGVIDAAQKKQEECVDDGWDIIDGGDWFTLFILLIFFAFQFCIGQVVSIILILKGAHGWCFCFALKLLKELDIQILSKPAVNIIRFLGFVYLLFNILGIVSITEDVSDCWTSRRMKEIFAVNLTYSIFTFILNWRLLPDSIKTKEEEVDPISQHNQTQEMKGCCAELNALSEKINKKEGCCNKLQAFFDHICCRVCGKYITFILCVISCGLGIWWVIAVILTAKYKSQCESSEWVTIHLHDWFVYILLGAFFSFQFGIGQLLPCITTDKSMPNTMTNYTTISCDCSCSMVMVPEWFVCALHGINIIFIIFNVLGMHVIRVQDNECWVARMMLRTFVVNFLHSIFNTWLGFAYWNGWCQLECCKQQKHKIS